MKEKSSLRSSESSFHVFFYAVILEEMKSLSSVNLASNLGRKRYLLDTNICIFYMKDKSDWLACISNICIENWID